MKKQTKNILIGILAIGLLIAGILVFGTGQSVLSQSSVYLDNGKVVWLVQGSANSYTPEAYTFSPSTYTYKDGSGTEVRPQDDLVLGVSKADTYCKYQTQKKSYLTPFFQKKYYYVLNPPEKVAKIEFADDKGNVKILDGTTVEQISMFDSDGKGEIKIETQGLLGGKFPCPQVDVIFFEDDKRFFDRFEWENNKEKILTSQFTTNFDDFEILSNNVVEGYVNIGNVVFTVTADQDYFNSVVYTPPKQADPNILYINTPSEIQQGQFSSIIAGIRNDADNKGDIIVTTSGDFSFSPSSTKVGFDSRETKDLRFNIQAPSSLGSATGTIKACGSSQFPGSVECDSKSFNVNIVSSDQEPQTSCGNGICEFNEDENSCPQDCTEIQPPIEVCPEIDLGPFGSIPDFVCLFKQFLFNMNQFFLKIKSLFAVVGLGIGTFLSRKLLINVKDIKKRKWLLWLLSIGGGLLAFYLIYTLFWIGVILLIILGIIKWIVPGI